MQSEVLLDKGRFWRGSGGPSPCAGRFTQETGPQSGPRPRGQAHGAQVSHILLQFSSDFGKNVPLFVIFISTNVLIMTIGKINAEGLKLEAYKLG